MEEKTIKTKYKRPFLIYRIHSEEAYHYAISIAQFILTNYETETIYVEHLEEINEKIIFPNDLQLQEKNKNKFEKFEIQKENSDLCIILGGDGCCLWANILYESKDRPPFITFHLGFLGYLAIYEIKKYQEVISELYTSDKYIYEKRKLIECQVFQEEKENKEPTRIKTMHSLNEILVERGESMKMLGLDVYLDNEPLTRVFSDGLIFSSSTGSTAYNLSAGGPLLNYDVEAMVVTAICPFSLSFRPLVLPPTVKMKLKSLKGYPHPSLTKDGNSRMYLEENQYAEVYLSQKYINFIILDKFIKNRVQLWKDKIIDSLGWNSAFKHY